ncbi:MAG: RDD family protein [Candidatus Marinarcus sp.]|uniref:RDD family protein n=1 Tax=Candidatus Marinarcus sp. TaxID=3100987 RepID=UPI003B00654E
MEKNEVIKLTRLRFLSNFINFITMPIVFILPILLITKIFNIEEVSIHLTSLPALIAILLHAALIHILYFGIFVKLTNGYTIGGLITGIKIISLDGKPLTIIGCAKRFLSAWNSNIYYTGYIYTKINSIGQFYYDEKYNTTIVKRGNKIPNTDSIKYYEHNFAKEFFIGFFVIFFTLMVLSSIFN